MSDMGKNYDQLKKSERRFKLGMAYLFHHILRHCDDSNRHSELLIKFVQNLFLKRFQAVLSILILLIER